MENASKALLIAGAVLLVIAIIAIGMEIFGTTKSVVGNAENQIDNMSVQMHNKQFESYSKEILTGNEAKELVVIVLSNNKKVKNELYKVTLELSNSNGTDIYIHSIDNLVGNEFDSKTSDGSFTVDETSIKFANRYRSIVTYDTNGIIKKFELNEV